MSELFHARKRLESCADYPVSKRPEDGELMTIVRVSDLRLALSAPPVTVEEVAAALMRVHGEGCKWANGSDDRSGPVEAVPVLWRKRHDRTGVPQ